MKISVFFFWNGNMVYYYEFLLTSAWFPYSASDLAHVSRVPQPEYGIRQWSIYSCRRFKNAEAVLYKIYCGCTYRVFVTIFRIWNTVLYSRTPFRVVYTHVRRQNDKNKNSRSVNKEKTLYLPSFFLCVRHENRIDLGPNDKIEVSSTKYIHETISKHVQRIIR